MNRTELKDFVIDGIANYFAGSGATWASDEARSLMAQAEGDWFNLPCDTDGATADQEEEMDDFLCNLALVILDLEEPFSHNYKMSYCGDKGADGNYTEYDGEVINAPSEEDAWDIFNGMAGEYGLPEARNYTMEEVE